MSQQAKMQELEQLRSQVAELEEQLHAEPPSDWVPRQYYTTYHILAGMVLGIIAASASLLFNVIGALMVGKHPLELIRVYLTFPMGDRALDLEGPQSGFVLAAGCCLYLMTGMFGGIPFHMILSRFFNQAAFGKRFMVATVLGLGIWIVNFYVVLSWLQPMLIGGNWIVERIPIPVAIGTHLIFGWAMMLLDQWGRFARTEHIEKEQAGS